MRHGRENRIKKPPGQRREAGERLVSLKQIAHELNVKGRTLRLVLRARYGVNGPGHYWIWSEREAEEVKQWLRRTLCLDGGGDAQED